jgi:two-component system phosphate regulon response regulator PhoB
MDSILLVEDDTVIREKLAKVLSSDYEVVGCATLAEARKKISERGFNLVLLDLRLPDGEGSKFHLEIRESADNKEAPVIFLTGESGPDEKVMAFMLGADDYIVKPFDMRELKARIAARIKKAKTRKQKDDVLQKGNLKIDLLHHRVSVNGKDVELTLTSFKLLLYFARHEGHVLSRDQLISGVWGNDVHVLDRTVDSHVSKLRKSLEESTHAILPVHGVGYKFAPAEKD